MIVFENGYSSNEWKQVIKEADEVLGKLGETVFTIQNGEVAKETKDAMTRRELFHFGKKV